MILFSGKKINVNLIYNGIKSTFELDQHQPLKYIKHLFKQIHPSLPFIPTISLPSSTPFTAEDDPTHLIDISGGSLNLTLVLAPPLENEPEEKLRCQCDNEVESFCVSCQEFCCGCCGRKNHSGHYVMNINMDNIEDSIKLMTISLNADISSEMYNAKKNNNYFHYVMFDKIHIWKENLITKINLIEKNIINIIQYKFDFDNEYKEYSAYLDAVSAKLNNKIRDIIDIIDINKSNLNLSIAGKCLNKIQSNFIEVKQITKEEKNKTMNHIDTIQSIDHEMNFIDSSMTALNESMEKLLSEMKKKFEKDQKEETMTTLVTQSTSSKKKTKKFIHISSKSLVDTFRKLSTPRSVIINNTEETNYYLMSDRNEKRSSSKKRVSLRNIAKKKAIELPKINISYNQKCN